MKLKEWKKNVSRYIYFKCKCENQNEDTANKISVFVWQCTDICSKKIVGDLVKCRSVTIKQVWHNKKVKDNNYLFILIKVPTYDDEWWNVWVEKDILSGNV